MNTTLRITEILPNPKGKDTNNEFIEITNFSNDTVNLKNFSLDDEEKGSKPYKFTEDTIIQPNSSKAFYNSQTKIALNNSNDSARLFDPSEKLVDELKYTKTTENKSISLTKIISYKSEKNTQTESDPTPNKSNKTLYKFDGKITNNQTGQFTFTEENSRKPLSITYSSNSKELSALTFRPNTEISILASKNSNSKFTLIDYKILKIPTKTEEVQKQNNELLRQIPIQALIFPIIILAIILTLLIKRNRIIACKQL